mmetsp:Transcript_32515/g.75157  ORF Transcript_32515/g.75157 Transcript_32515/m.75157 type:complete len:920 (+) Transcript_32515:42-2801(+)
MAEANRLSDGSDTERGEAPLLLASAAAAPRKVGWLLPALVAALLMAGLCLLPQRQALRGSEDSKTLLELNNLNSFLYAPVDGGVQRACRGADSNDNSPLHFVASAAPDLPACQYQCLHHAGCQGVEFHELNGRCELWTRPGGIEASAFFANSECYRRVGNFEPVDGGDGRACRGATVDDNNPANYEVHPDALLDECERRCLHMSLCTGIEHSLGRCEIYLRPDGPQASVALQGFSCYRAVMTATTPAPTTQTVTATVTATSLTTVTTVTSMTTTTVETTMMEAPPPSEVYFIPVDGGVNRACRGADVNDNDANYFQVFTVADLGGCMDRCRETPGCVGIESINTRCEVWTRQAGIEATFPLTGYQCLEVFAFYPVDGADGRACRGANPSDSSPDYYVVFPETSLADCQLRCVNAEACVGVEYSYGRCEVWTRNILASAAVPGFQCFQFSTARRQQLLAEVAFSTWDVVGGGVDRECRGGSWSDDSPGYFSVAQANSLSRCQERCMELTICQGVEYRTGHCEMWTRPEGIGATAARNHSVCLRRPVLGDGPAPTGNTRTKYVVHYMPWFLGIKTPGVYDHWCKGNSYYQSFLGLYDQNEREVIGEQLDLMKASGIDGLWIDYQLTSWDSVVDLIVDELEARGMGVAIVVDNAVNNNIFGEAQAKLVQWLGRSHYYRHNGLPVVPVFNDVEINFEPIPLEVYYMTRREVARPDWANGTYPWITSDLNWLEAHYKQDHSLESFAIGAAYRGFRDCYSNRMLHVPFLQMLEPSLLLTAKYQPEFVQVLTWNDYSEGTMIEPSWLRAHESCHSPCSDAGYIPCPTSDDCFSGLETRDCDKPYGAPYGPTDPMCASAGNRSADEDLLTLRQHIQMERSGTLNSLFHSGLFTPSADAKPPGWYHRGHEGEPKQAQLKTPQFVDFVK